MADAGCPVDDDAAAAEAVEEEHSKPVHPSPGELVAKAIAPVKRDFLRPPPVRASSSSNNANPVGGGGDVGSDRKSLPAKSVVQEKKSKRQLKRERQQERKSASHICPDVAKTGNPSACVYGTKCRFSHDLVAFQAQKPEDIPGDCPFLSFEGPCPYGIACRFSGTHKGGLAETTSFQRQSSEVNGLSKDVQKLLWKDQMCFTRADAELKRLGLVVKENPRARKNLACNGRSSADVTEADFIDKDVNDSSPKQTGEEDPQNIFLEKGCVNDKVLITDSHPPKRPKITADGVLDVFETTNGTTSPEKGVEASGMDSDSAVNSEVAVSEIGSGIRLNAREKKIIDFSGKLYLAPLTTVGNLPFRRVCKGLGADITCGEMAMCTNLLQGQASEWALLRRHSSEDLFGVQICGAYADTVSRTVDLIDRECRVDFIDINMGCPIDIVVNKGAGSSLLVKPMRMKNIIHATSCTVDIPITVKVRTGYVEGRNRIDSLIADISNWGATAVTIHGRSRQQRYSKLADWDYIYECARKSPSALQVLGNGDIFSYTDWNNHVAICPELASCMIARGALIKPWIFTEIKEQRHWDISSVERLNILKNFVRHGLEHWGSDTKGVETTRHFLLEWLSYTHRYIPVGLLDVIPQRLNWRPPSFYGRDELETLMASDSAADWIRISEMLLGKVPAGFTFAPKHKSNAYERPENG